MVTLLCTPKHHTAVYLVYLLVPLCLSICSQSALSTEVESRCYRTDKGMMFAVLIEAKKKKTKDKPVKAFNDNENKFFNGECIFSEKKCSVAEFTPGEPLSVRNPVRWADPTVEVLKPNLVRLRFFPATKLSLEFRFFDKAKKAEVVLKDGFFHREGKSSCELRKGLKILEGF